MSVDVLDPRHLAISTPWSFDTWSRCLCAARADGVPESVLADLVSKGATPWLVYSVQTVLVPLAKQVNELVGQFAAYMPEPKPEPPTDIRERALWLRQHRNTGPELPHAWRKT